MDMINQPQKTLLASWLTLAKRLRLVDLYDIGEARGEMNELERETPPVCDASRVSWLDEGILTVFGGQECPSPSV